MKKKESCYININEFKETAYNITNLILINAVEYDIEEVDKLYYEIYYENQYEDFIRINIKFTEYSCRMFITVRYLGYLYTITSLEKNNNELIKLYLYFLDKDYKNIFKYMIENKKGYVYRA